MHTYTHINTHKHTHTYTHIYNHTCTEGSWETVPTACTPHTPYRANPYQATVLPREAPTQAAAVAVAMLIVWTIAAL